MHDVPSSAGPALYRSHTVWPALSAASDCVIAELTTHNCCSVQTSDTTRNDQPQLFGVGLDLSENGSSETVYDEADRNLAVG